MADSPDLYNAHVDGSPCFWQAGPVGVLLAHGLTATPAEVLPLASRLFAAGYTVAAPLLAGHAETPESLNETRWPEWYWCVTETYHRLALTCNTVVAGGQSTGAVLALLLASRHPQVAGVLCYSPALRLALSPLDRVRLRLVAHFVPSRPKPRLDESELWQGYRVNPLRATLELTRLAALVRRRLHKVHQPVLIVQGRNDLTVDLSSGELVKRGVASELVAHQWLEQSGHILLLEEEFDQVVALTLDFLAQLETGSPGRGSASSWQRIEDHQGARYPGGREKL